MAKLYDPLFELVQSMTKSEKRYFKLSASLHTGGKENNGLKLFSYMDRQKEYCEDHLRAQFKGEAFLNKLSISKKRLYDNLLQTLNTYHQNNSPAAQLYGMIQSAEVLFEKGLYRQSEKTLNKAEKWAEKYELVTGRLEIQRFRRKLLEQSSYLQVEAKTVDNLDQNTKTLLDLLKEEAELWTLKSKLLKQLITKGKFEENECNQVFRLLDEHEGGQRTLESQYLKNHLESAFHFGKQNLVDSLASLRANYELFKQNKAFLQAHKERFIATLSNAIYAADRLNLNDLVQTWMSELHTWHKDLAEDNNCDLQARSFTSVFSVEVSHLSKRGQFTEVCEKEMEVLAGLERYQKHISAARRAFFHFKLGESFLICNLPSRALVHLREILNDSELDDKEDIVQGAHMLHLLVHLELGNFDTMPYLVRSTKRYLKKRGRLGTTEEIFLSTMMAFKNNPNIFDQEDIWTKYLNKLEDLQNQGADMSTGYFDFKMWAESKIDQVEYSALYQSKLEKTAVAV